ncbi:MAG: DUF5318 family protein [Acidimicrobiales bacterium]
MKLGLSAATTDVPGEIDYRLERQRILSEWRAGELSAHQICDAQAELRRNAAHCGVDTDEPCPVCEDHSLRHVTYVFGPRLPAHGRCITSDGEMARIRRRKGVFTGYVVEVCPGCGWNHLVRSSLLNPLG